MSTEISTLGEFGLIKHLTEHDGLYAPHHLGWLKLYLPARSAQVLRLKPAPKPRKRPVAKKK